MHPWLEKAENGLHRLRVGLRITMAERRAGIETASASFGRHPTYWGRVLSGRLEAKVLEVFELLYQLQVPGEVFFTIYFTPTVEPELGARSAFSFLPAPGGVQLPALDRRAFGARASDHWDGEIWCDWVRARLLEESSARGLKLREVDRALGLPLDAASRSLGGQQRLTFRVVLGLLAALGLPPHRFFRRATPLPRVTLPSGEDLATLLSRLTSLEPATTGSAKSLGGRKGRRRRDSSARRLG